MTGIDYVYILPNGSLHITNMTSVLGGQYVCVAENMAGTGTATITVRFLGISSCVSSNLCIKCWVCVLCRNSEAASRGSTFPHTCLPWRERDPVLPRRRLHPLL